jgi:hypothetical protein
MIQFIKRLFGGKRTYFISGTSGSALVALGMIGYTVEHHNTIAAGVEIWDLRNPDKKRTPLSVVKNKHALEVHMGGKSWLPL